MTSQHAFQSSLLIQGKAPEPIDEDFLSIIIPILIKNIKMLSIFSSVFLY